MSNQQPFTVLILAAGHGRRMGPFSRMINKSLVPYNNKPLISHIMAKFPIETKFVIACGHNGQQVKDYVSVVHADKDITFVDINKYDESTTGPATTIAQCSRFIENSFFCITCDTLFDFEYQDKLDENWIGVHPVDSHISGDYCWVKRNGNEITSIHNKVKSSGAVDAFIGLMYFKDTTYIDLLKKDSAREIYEGFDKTLNLKAYTVNDWKDFGTYGKWKELSSSIPEVSLHKPGEIFYNDNNFIIKYNQDVNLTNLKELRSRLNQVCMPSGVIQSGNFLIYNKVPGNVLHDYLTPRIFEKFLLWAETAIWRKIGRAITEESCNKFYKDKTYDRLDTFRVKHHNWDESTTVNNIAVNPINEYLSAIDFEWLSMERYPCFTHGDLQFDNIIFDINTEEFTAIDWRADFADNLYGDLYYDLAKMLGGLYLSFKKVREQGITYKEDNTVVTIKLLPVDNVEYYVSRLESWVKEKGLNWNKVLTLVPIIYLNMAPLHDEPFDKYLIALSQLYFSQLN